MSSRRTRALLTAAALLAALVVCGCSTLPTSGDVETRPDSQGGSGAGAPYFVPPGPTPGDSPEGVVRGFLLAMQANPPSTAVARRFLSERARNSWKPGEGTIVYDASTVETQGDGVVARLSDAHRLDPSGRWASGTITQTARISFELAEQDGEWRISNPPNALAVPASYFSSLFVPFNLYFYDRTGSVLVPARVYLPRGEQTASNLVRGLLAGPPTRQRAMLTTAFPSDTGFGLGVVVSDDGVAEVPLGQAVLGLPPAELGRLVAQLGWTLQQVPGINRVRITVEGVTVPLADGQTEVPVRDGVEYDPVAAAGRDLIAVAGGRVVRVEDGEAAPLGGPLGQAGIAMRSVALDASTDQVAAVAENGRRLYVAPDRGATDRARIRIRVDGATDLLRPVFDRFGSLWTIDRTAGGAVVHVVTGNADRVLEVPGITGQRIVAFTLTRDGTQLVAALAGNGPPRLLVAGIVRGEGGRPTQALDSIRLALTDPATGTIVDLAQNDATTVAVLTRTAESPAAVTVIELDGSPGETGADVPNVLQGAVSGLAAGPDPSLPLAVVTGDQRLLILNDTSSQWARTSVKDVRAIAYPQ